MVLHPLALCSEIVRFLALPFQLNSCPEGLRPSLAETTYEPTHELH